MDDEREWSITVSVDGEDILTISRSELAGLPDLGPYEDLIRTAGRSLLSFIGEKQTPKTDDGDNIPF